MNKNSFVFIGLVFFLTFGMFSCGEEANPKVVIQVVETVDSVLVPVSQAFVEIRPATQENVLEDVIADGFANSNGYIEFEFEKKLVLRAEAKKYKRDEGGKIIPDSNGDPITIKSNYKTVVLDFDYVDNQTIEVK